MTSTSCGSDLHVERNTSRVLRPPGGASSDIFGTASSAPPPPKAQPAKAHAHTDIFGAPIRQGAPPAKKEDTGDRVFGDTFGVKPVENRSVPEPYVEEKYEDTSSGMQRQQTRANYNILTGEGDPMCWSDTPEKMKSRNRGGYNPITHGGDKSPSSVTPSTRVRHPPGGASSNIFG